MGTLLKYSGIVTKVRAMSSHLLTADDYITIANSVSVLDVVAYLKKHPAYEDAFSDLNEQLLHRGDIEKILIQSLYKDYSKLYRFGNSDIREFLLFYLRRYEIDLINYCFRIVFNEYPEPFDLAHKREFFDQYSSISIDMLITSTNIEELVYHLQGTEYYEPLAKLQNQTNATLFDYNLALDLYYYTSLWKNAKKHLKHKELEVSNNEIGCKIDLLNLQWIHQAKMYYSLSISEIYALLIPINYHLSKEQFKALVEAPTIDDFNNLVLQTYYGKRYARHKIVSLEHMYKTCLVQCYKKDCRDSPYSLAPVTMYLYQKEEEIRKITTALECIRYEIDPSESLNYIGGIAQ